MASLVDQIFIQSQAGSAQGQGFGDFFVQGKQLSQNQQRINLMERQLAQQIAMDQVQKTTMLQQQDLNRIKLQDALETQQAIVGTAEKQLEMTNLYRQYMNAKEPEKAKLAVLDFIASTPGGWRVPLADTLLQDANKGIEAKMELVKARGGDFTPGFGTAVNPVTNQPEAYFKTSPNSAQLVKPEGAERGTAAIQNAGELDKLQNELVAAQQSGDTEAIARAKRRLDTFTGLVTPASETMVFDPRSGEVRIEKGRKAGDLTIANQTRAQSTLSDSIQSIDIANRLEPMISGETVGLRAFAESWVKDRVLAQAFPEMASNRRATAESLVAQLRASAIRELRSDGNISDRERQQILQAIPSINAPIDSPARAKQLVQDIRTMSAVHAVVASSKLAKPIPKVAAQALSPQDLQRLVKSGIITPEQALAAFDAR